MNLVALLLLAAQAASGGDSERVSQPALIEAFRAFCLAGAASAGTLEAPAIAAGFHPVPVTPPSRGWNEIGAWQRGGMRIFSLSAQTGPASPPICGVRAKIGRLVEDNMLLDPVARMADSVFVEGNPGSSRSGWIIVGRQRFVRVSIDRSNQADVGVVLLADPVRP